MLDKAYDLLPTVRARQLRTNATTPERMLWSALRNRQLKGARFNRQVPIGPYICDFVARSVKLVIELDGGQHSAAAAYDEARTRFLTSKGYRVIRFWNGDVFQNRDGVVLTILAALASPAGAGREETRSAEGEDLFPLDDMPSPPDACGVSVPSRSGGRG